MNRNISASLPCGKGTKFQAGLSAGSGSAEGRNGMGHHRRLSQALVRREEYGPRVDADDDG